MSSQKWLPVAITLNQTHAGHASQSAFAHGRRTTAAITTPTMSASQLWRLGIAAGIAVAFVAGGVVYGPARLRRARLA